RRSKIRRQKQPQEPHRSAGPKRQGKPMPPVSGNAWISCRLEIRRIEGQGHQKRHYAGKRKAEAQNTAMEKWSPLLALQAGPDEKARKKEEERHQKHGLPRAEHVEAKPSLGVDDREGAPKIGGLSKTNGSDGKNFR